MVLTLKDTKHLHFFFGCFYNTLKSFTTDTAEYERDGPSADLYDNELVS